MFKTRLPAVSAMTLGMALFGLTGCAADAGYLVADNQSGSICTPEAEAGGALFSHHTFTNESSSEVALAGIELSDPRNLRIESFNVLLDGQDGFRGTTDDRDQFPAEHTNTIPAGSTATLQLVLALDDRALSGKSDGLDLIYGTPGDEPQVLRADASIDVAPTGTSCFEPGTAGSRVDW